MAGKHEKALGILGEIERDFGVSFWLLERKLMLAQDMGGFEEHKEKLREIRDSCDDAYVNYVAYFISARLEPHVSWEAFQSKMKRTFEDLVSKKFLPLRWSLEFQASPWSCGWLGESHPLLYRCGGKPMVDRYLHALKIVSLRYFHEVPDATQMHHLRNILKDLHNSISDPQIERIMQLYGCDDGRNLLDDKSANFIEAHDCLITEDYESALSKITNLLTSEPLLFDNYWLYSQVQIASGVGSTCEFPPSSMALEILDNVYKVVDNRGGVELPLQILLNRSLKLGENNLGLSLWQFAEIEQTGLDSTWAKCHASLMGRMCVAGVLSGLGVEIAPQTIEKLLYSLPNSPTVRLIAFQHGRMLNFDNTITPVADAIKRLAFAQRAEKDGQSDQVVALLSSLVMPRENRSSLDKLCQVKAAQIYFDARIELGEYFEAANDVVVIYNENPNNLRHVPFDRLIDLGKDGECAELISSINWPILIFLGNGNEQDLYEAVDEFFTSAGISDPVEFLDFTDTPLAPAERLLIKSVLIPQVLERSPLWTSNQEELRTLRATLLNRLYESSEEDQEFVVAELSQIEQEKLLEADFQNVEGPKFLLDFTDVNKRLMPILQVAFDRFSLYKSYEDSGGNLEDEEDLFGKLTGKSESQRSTTTKEDKYSVSETLLAGAVTAMFNGYLWDSRNSINSNLGTSIRHGSLENQLKRSFEHFGFLATVDPDGLYECDPKMAQKISAFDEEEGEEITEAIFSFTKGFYGLCEDLVNHKLRVKVPLVIIERIKQEGLPSDELADEEGLLDFSEAYDIERILAEFRVEAPIDSAALILGARKIFEEVVGKALAATQLYFEEIVVPYVAQLVESIEVVLQKCRSAREAHTSLENELTLAKDGFSYDIRNIKKWFSVARNIDQITGSFVKLLEMAARVVNLASNHRLGQLTPLLVSDEQISGISRVALYEVLLILFRNVVRHSGLESGQEIIYSLGVDAEGRFNLSVSNLMIPTEKLDKAIAGAEECLSGDHEDEILSKGPGKTGLKRIKRLLSQVSDRKVEIVVSRDGGGADGARFKIWIVF